MISKRRISKEFQRLESQPEVQVASRVEKPSKAHVEEWHLVLKGAVGTLYEGEDFQLRVRFPSDYPIAAPEVQFSPPHVPIHPHVYSNGHICLSILYDEWSPALTTLSVCLSILSMLSSCTEKELPPGNDEYVARAPASSTQSRWLFHDDNV